MMSHSQQIHILLPIKSILLIFLAFASCTNNPQQAPEQPAPSARVNLPSEKLEQKASTDSFDLLIAKGKNDHRFIWQKPDLVISLLGDLKDKTVADIGAGSGYFAFRLVPKAKKVIAIEIDPQMINFMDSVKIRLSDEGQSRFETRLTTPDNPKLAASETDVVMIVDTYGYISNRNRYLKLIQKGLSDQGEILIIDFKKSKLPEQVGGGYKVGISTVVKELEDAGFTITKVDNVSLDYQYIIQAVKSPK